MSPTFSIRRATAEDAGLLAHHRVALFREASRAPLVIPEEVFAAATRAAAVIALDGPDCLAWIALSPAGEPIASSVVHVSRRLPTPRNLTGVEGYLIQMFIAAEWRRRGVGAALVEALTAAARERGVSRIRLRATPDGKLLYRRFGFDEEPDMMELYL